MGNCPMSLKSKSVNSPFYITATFNSAPMLSSTLTKTGAVNRSDDSLEDFVVTKKATKKKIASVFASSSDEEDENTEQDTFSSPVLKVTKAKDESKDAFDRLFEAGPVRRAIVPSLNNYSSSTSELTESSNSNLLFASFDHASPLKESAKNDEKPKKPRKKKTEKVLTIPEVTRRHFSDKTLEIVAEEMEKLKVKRQDSSDVSDDVFNSPEQAGGCLLKIEENSPTFIGMQATSTPNLGYLRLSEVVVSAPSPSTEEVEKESVKSPPRLSLFLPPKPPLVKPATELIPRKGGKHWRRSIVRMSNVAGSAAVDNRRATVLAVETVRVQVSF